MSTYKLCIGNQYQPIFCRSISFKKFNILLDYLIIPEERLLTTIEQIVSCLVGLDSTFESDDNEIL